jgi:hypothetical protein
MRGCEMEMGQDEEQRMIFMMMRTESEVRVICASDLLVRLLACHFECECED